jgi:hypothetical protein
VPYTPSRCSPKKKLSRSSSLRNVLHHADDSHGREGCIPSPRSEAFASTAAVRDGDAPDSSQENSHVGNDVEDKTKRKRSSSLKDRARAFVRRLSVSEAEGETTIAAGTGSASLTVLPCQSSV